MKEVQEDEVLFEKTDEESVTIATTLVALTQDTAKKCDNVDEKLLQEEYENIKLKDEILSL